MLRARSIKITVVHVKCEVGGAADYAYLTVHDSEPACQNINMVHVYSVHAFIGLLSSCAIFGLRWIRMELGRHGVDKQSAV